MWRGVIGAAAAMTGTTWTAEARAAQAAKEAAAPIGSAALSPDLDVVKMARPTLQTVANECGETVYIAVWNGTDTIMMVSVRLPAVLPVPSFF